jgi:hypothetical protein
MHQLSQNLQDPIISPKAFHTWDMQACGGISYLNQMQFYLVNDEWLYIKKNLKRLQTSCRKYKINNSMKIIL